MDSSSQVKSPYLALFGCLGVLGLLVLALSILFKPLIAEFRGPYHNATALADLENDDHPDIFAGHMTGIIASGTTTGRGDSGSRKG